MAKPLKTKDLGRLQPVQKHGFVYNLKKYWPFYVMLLPMLVFLAIFCCLPMGGVVMAFQDFRPARGFFRSEWVGLENFSKSSPTRCSGKSCAIR